MNSSAGAGNYRRGSAKGDKVTAAAPPARKKKAHSGLGGVEVAVAARRCSRVEQTIVLVVGAAEMLRHGWNSARRHSEHFHLVLGDVEQNFLSYANACSLSCSKVVKLLKLFKNVA